MQRQVFCRFAALAGNASAAVGASAPSAAWLAAQRRGLHATSVSRAAFDEFFDASMMEGARQPSGRPWEASELRLKSFEDLHKLWFVCLKERNMLLTERLYYRQVAQSAPEPSRILKVRATMRAIKVVLGERARAAQALAHDQEIGLRAENEAGRMSARLQNAMLDPVDRLLRPVPFPEPKRVKPLTKKESARAAAIAAMKEKDPRLAAAMEIKDKLSPDVTVTFKKWGRKYTVPARDAPDGPTAAQKATTARSRAFFAKRRAILNSPPTPAPEPSAYVWATEGVQMKKPSLASKVRLAAKAKATKAKATTARRAAQAGTAKPQAASASA